MAGIKRAIALPGDEPAVGLGIGVLERLTEETDLNLDVWSTACIGAWPAVVWHQAGARCEYEQTVAFVKRICRPEKPYDRFPIAADFAPDFFSSAAIASEDGVKLFKDKVPKVVGIFASSKSRLKPMSAMTGLGKIWIKASWTAFT